LREGQPGIAGRGARLALILCQNPEAVRLFLEREPLPFPVAVDVDRATVRAYGVHHLLGFDALNIARPATFVIDAAGLVRARFVARRQWQAMPLAEIGAALARPD
jgi:peroxiredoxin